MHTLLKQRRMRWLGHVVRMEDGRIPKDLLYGELAQGTRPIGRPQLRFKDLCKRDLKDLNVDLTTWETSASDRSTWRQLTRRALSRSEDSLRLRNEERRRKRKTQTTEQHETGFTCSKCGKICLSRIGLHSHTRRCSRTSQSTNP